MATSDPDQLELPLALKPARRARVDDRSLGVILLDSDRLARDLLADVDTHAAKGMLAAWPATVAAATRLWSALPVEQTPDQIAAVDRLAAHAETIKTGLGQARGKAPTRDPRFKELTRNLGRAGTLAAAGKQNIDDVHAASTRVVHIAYLATHSVTVALGRHRGGGLQAQWADRIQTAERILGDYLNPTPYPTIAAETPAGDPLSQLHQALARFDIQAHRTLVTDPTPANAVLATRAESLFLGAALTLTQAATSTRAMSGTNLDPVRLEKLITTAGQSWSDLAHRWGDMMPRGVRISPELAQAANQLRDACRTITHTDEILATPKTIARRVDLSAALPVLERYIEAGAHLATATQPLLRDPGLVAPPQAIVRRLARDSEGGRRRIPNEGSIAEVINRAARTNEPGPIPRQVIDALSTATTRASRTSTRAAACLSAGVPQVASRADHRAAQMPAAPTAAQGVRREVPDDLRAPSARAERGFPV